MMLNAVVKHSVYAGGQSVILGRYIDHNDKLKEVEFMGTTQDADALILRLQRSGSEFQCVRIHEL